MERYHRQILLPEISNQGQQKINNAAILVVGVGGLGSIISLYLTSIGVGRIGLVDGDIVSMNNLHRQILYNTSEIGKSKVDCAKNNLLLKNDSVIIQTFDCYLDDLNVEQIAENYSIIIDGLDNIKTRYIIDDYCRKNKKPYIYGGITDFSGQISVFNYNGSKSYSDLFPRLENPNENIYKSESGVLPILPGIIGLLQVNEAIKIITGFGEVLANKLLQYDVKNNSQILISY
jgi:adenylyltransferase/sulfurtransferase